MIWPCLLVTCQITWCSVWICVRDFPCNSAISRNKGDYREGKGNNYGICHAHFAGSFHSAHGRGRCEIDGAVWFTVSEDTASWSIIMEDSRSPVLLPPSLVGGRHILACWLCSWRPALLDLWWDQEKNGQKECSHKLFFFFLSLSHKRRDAHKNTHAVFVIEMNIFYCMWERETFIIRSVAGSRTTNTQHWGQYWF